VSPNRNYVVRIDLHENSGVLNDLDKIPTFANIPNLLGDDADSDGILHLDNETGHQVVDVPVVLGSELSANNIDFGFRPRLAIGDYVWYDENANGLQDSFELPLVNITLDLLLADLTYLESTKTNQLGLYNFTNILPRKRYVVQISTISQSNMMIIGERVPTYFPFFITNTTTDSKGQPNIVNVRSPQIQVEITVVSNIDFGFRDALKIGGLVFCDSNANGIFEPEIGEPVIEMILVELYALNGPYLTIDASTTTGYLFENLEIGDINNGPTYVNPFSNYTVAIKRNMNSVALKDKEPTVVIVSMNNQTVSRGTIFAKDAKGFTTVSTDVFVRNTNQLMVHFGFRPRISISGNVWCDSDGDGILESGEPFIDSEVLLYLANGSFVASTHPTLATGIYTFENVLPNTEYLVVVLITNLRRPTIPFQGTNTSLDSNLQDGIEPGTSKLAGVANVSVGISNVWDIGVGLRPVINIGYSVWNDKNSNGMRDIPDDNGIPGVVLLLADTASGITIRNVTTDSNGEYIFRDVNANTLYSVIIDLEANAAVLGPRSPTFPGVGNSSVSSIGVLTSNAQGIAISMSSPIDTSITTCTAPLINYVNFGFRPRLDIGDFVWMDLDADGLQDEFESGINNVLLHLLNSSFHEVQQTHTNGSGYYSFLNVHPMSTYYVLIYFSENSGPLGSLTTTLFNVLPGTQSTVNSKGFPPGKQGTFLDSAVANVSINLASDRAIDFGFRPALRIGEFVWCDTNGDGFEDDLSTEPGIPGVVLTLLNATGAVLDMTVSNATGYYYFVDVDPGASYFVRIDLTDPANVVALQGKFPTFYGQDSVGNLVSSFLISDIIEITDSDDIFNDFGFRPEINIGDYVWFDADADGLQDPIIDTGIPGVTLTLRNNTGHIEQTVMSDANGYYLFRNVQPDQTYIVSIDLVDPVNAILANYAPTFAVPGDTSIDSNGQPTYDYGVPNPPIVSAIVLPPQLNEFSNCTWLAGLTIDFGFRPFRKLEIGDLIFNDQNGDGLFNIGDTPIGGVQVQLYWNGNIIATTLSDPITGIYKFGPVTANQEYKIVIPLNTAPNNMIINGTLPTILVPGNPTIDSNGQLDPSGTSVSASVFITLSEDFAVDFGFTKIPPPPGVPESCTMLTYLVDARNTLESVVKSSLLGDKWKQDNVISGNDDSHGDFYGTVNYLRRSVEGSDSDDDDDDSHNSDDHEGCTDCKHDGRNNDYSKEHSNVDDDDVDCHKFPLKVSVTGNVNRTCFTFIPTNGIRIGQFDYFALSGTNLTINTTSVVSAFTANGKNVSHHVHIEHYVPGVPPCSNRPGCLGHPPTLFTLYPLVEGDIVICTGCGENEYTKAPLHVCFDGVPTASLTSVKIKVSSRAVEKYCSSVLSAYGELPPVCTPVVPTPTASACKGLSAVVICNVKCEVYEKRHSHKEISSNDDLGNNDVGYGNGYGYGNKYYGEYDDRYYDAYGYGNDLYDRGYGYGQKGEYGAGFGGGYGGNDFSNNDYASGSYNKRSLMGTNVDGDDDDGGKQKEKEKENEKEKLISITPLTITATSPSPSTVCVKISATPGVSISRLQYISFVGQHIPITGATILSATGGLHGASIVNRTRTEVFSSGNVACATPTCNGFNVNTGEHVDLHPGDTTVCLACDCYDGVATDVEVCFFKSGMVLEDFVNSIIKVHAEGVSGFCGANKVVAVGVLQPCDDKQKEEDCDHDDDDKKEPEKEVEKEVVKHKERNKKKKKSKNGKVLNIKVYRLKK